MTGELLLRYEEMAEEMGDKDQFAHIGGGVSAFAKRLARSIDPDGGLSFEVAEACEGLSETSAAALKEGVERARLILESPIENVLLPWLLAQSYRFFPRRPLLRLVGESADMEELDLAIVPQLPIGRYRVDMAIAAKKYGVTRFVIVEADGSAFHDSVEQVKRDLERDVWLLGRKRVLDIIRLDGKEIYRSPKLAAAKVEECVFNAWRKDNSSTAEKFKD